MNERDLLNPHIHQQLLNAGAPTFEQFKKDREKFLPQISGQEILASVDEGGKALKQSMNKRMMYEIEGYRCKTLEEVERVAKSQGIPIEALDYSPQVIPQAGHKCDILVKFVPKWVREKRNAW
jgi:hypothetical protein